MSISIPKDFEVQPLKAGENPPGRVTCGTCGLSWDDSISTGWTPAPGGRCPFEYYHENEEEVVVEDTADDNALITQDGYLVKALDLLPLIDEDYREELEQLITDGNTAQAEQLLLSLWDHPYPPIQSVFLLGPDDVGDDIMTTGTTYVDFARDDLFKWTPSIGMQSLMNDGVEPKICEWGMWEDQTD